MKYKDKAVKSIKDKTSLFAKGMGVLALLCYVAFSSQTVKAANEEQIIEITRDGQSVDAFCGVGATYIKGASNTGAYSCAGYVKKFYSTLFNVDIYQINTYDGPPMIYNSKGKTKLVKISKPRKGDIFQNKARTHVGVVKENDKSGIILIEQNYKWYENDKVYCRINRRVTVDDGYFYRLYIDGMPVEASKFVSDTTPPEITNVKIVDRDDKGYTVECTVKDNGVISRVQFPTWSVKDGQDDIVPDWATNPKCSGKIESNGKVSFRVNIANHGGLRGRYITHIYAYDASGNCKGYPLAITCAGQEDFGTFYGTMETTAKTFVDNQVVKGVSNVYSSKKTDKHRQIWKFERQSDGGYLIRSVLNNKYLTVNKNSANSKANVYTDNLVGKTGSTGQRWYFFEKKGKYYIGALCTDCYLTMDDVPSAEGANVRMRIGNGNAKQMFTVKRYPYTPEFLSAKALGHNAMTLKWNKVTGAEGYHVFCYDEKTKKYVKIAAVMGSDTTQYTLFNLEKGKKYKFKIKSFMTLGGVELTSDYSVYKVAKAR